METQLQNQFKLLQAFGNNQSNDIAPEDIISCIRYDPTGGYLCLGDNDGRVIIFQGQGAVGDGTEDSWGEEDTDGQM